VLQWFIYTIETRSNEGLQGYPHTKGEERSDLRYQWREVVEGLYLMQSISMERLGVSVPCISLDSECILQETRTSVKAIEMFETVLEIGYALNRHSGTFSFVTPR
jgi:hypothetical protein